MKHVGKSGRAIAAAAFTLAVAGAAIAPAFAESDNTHICRGVNACKGQSDCHSYKNSCKGQNACKGQGFKLLSMIDCQRAGGTVVDVN
jgi:uncharacterized membrane protein